MSELTGDEGTGGDPTETKTARRRNRWLLFTVLGTLTAVLLAAVGVVAFYSKTAYDALDNINREPTIMPTGTNRPPTVAPVPGQEHAPINIVLMGSDTRGAERGRSDVLQLLHVSGDRTQVYLMSLPATPGSTSPAAARRRSTPPTRGAGRR
ncbi:hypothetical protein G7085_13055 [Tessaracoccus sp. HDW20]|uniref:hypothetical protein n=1 Tax=Tessaracoccus coleopterorum TaxID=2714950 RepID=UPI0018D368E2|nr:hypothetical protein [Tessaracoccus coleopterorum]NHB85242.1 hypothetical protein [Tessaracoccus coleopterorum]